MTLSFTRRTVCRLHDVLRNVRRLETFLGASGIVEARKRLEVIKSSPNLYRLALIAQKQPWLQAFAELQQFTINGPRLIRRKHLTESVLVAAYAGDLLATIESTLPPKVRKQMIGRLLDLHGKARSVVMEWHAADFYLRRGYSVTWLDGPGPEFRCAGHGLAFEVECKRILRNTRNLLDDGAAATITKGVQDAVASMGLCGELMLDASVTTATSASDVSSTILATIPNQPQEAIDLLVPDLGRLCGSLRALPQATSNDEVFRRMNELGALAPPDFRSCGVPVPYGASNIGAIVVYLRGPRRTLIELRDHLHEVLRGGASQLSGTLPGVLMIELEGNDDATLYRNNPAFTQLAESVFSLHPSAASVVWCGEPTLRPQLKMIELAQSEYACGNIQCTFESGQAIHSLKQ